VSIVEVIDQVSKEGQEIIGAGPGQLVHASQIEIRVGVDQQVPKTCGPSQARSQFGIDVALFGEQPEGIA
jgi:hypothetical protein